MNREKNNFVKNTFLKLTSRTYPFGYENEVIDLLRENDLIPNDISQDESGNWFLKIGESKTMFTSHLDTACKEQVEVRHVIEGNMIKTDGKSVLGADDKSGMTVMLYMIKHKVPGLYYFFFGEEVGCVGSSLAAKDPMFKGYDRCVAFDRRGTDSIITYQSSKRCCSDDFARSLQSEFRKNGMTYKLDEGGIYTDSAEFTEVIPECTNISVGYYSEHTHTERQDISHLERLANAVIGINWEKLVTKRDPKVVTVKKYTQTNHNSKRYKTYDDYDDNDFQKSNYGTNIGSRDGRISSWNGYDDEFLDRTSKGGRKRNRRGRKNPREFYSGPRGEIIPIINNKVDLKFVPDYNDINTDERHKFDFYIDKFIDNKLSAEEIQSVKEQFIDFKNLNDKKAMDVLMTCMCV